MTLHFELAAPDTARNAANLVKLLRKEGGRLVTDFMGTTCFTQGMADCGWVDEACELAVQGRFPVLAKVGATTIWEHWDGLRRDWTRIRQIRATIMPS